jgi:hypothetical protein
LFGKDKKKERFDFILEPLQAMTQLALMSFCPIGSKLSIQNNILCIQMPTWTQGLWRNYNNDSRDDVFFLFNAISRFSRFYRFWKTRDDLVTICPSLYDLLVKLAKRGLDNMLQTYANVQQPSLLHTLQMYRSMLDKPELFLHNGTVSGGDDDTTAITTKEIDDVFIQIINIYSQEDLNIMFDVFTLLERQPDSYLTYMQGLNSIMTPRNTEIKKWINDKIVY